MIVAVKSLAGLGGLPVDRSALSAWLRRNGIPTVMKSGPGGKAEHVRLSDLPETVRLAYLKQQIETLHLDPGTYDDAAHEAFMQASPSRRDRAERKAAMARLLVSLGPTVRWEERLRLVHDQFGKEGASKPRLKALLTAVKGVDPINYAPALLDNYKGSPSCFEITPKAWQYFMTTIRDAAPEFPLIQAWRDTRDVGKKQGWHWPSYPTVYSRWRELSEAQRHAARYGRADAVKRFAQPIHRDKTSIGPLEWVSLDGRTKDFWTDRGDGRPLRMTMLVLVDVATNMVLDFEIASSENAADTVRLIKRTCETYGIFDRLYTDNSTAFAGHLVAGGNIHRFRNAGKTAPELQPPGICKHLGIDLHYALPGNGQAKIAERTFAVFSRGIDNRPEFKGAHAGHEPGASPDSDVVPIPFDLAERIVRNAINRHNRETGRRSQGALGRSYEQMFQDEVAHRIKRQPTARQLYLAGLMYKPVSVDRNGQVKVNGWVYGSPTTQLTLLKHHGTGQKILLGRDPDDFSAPALAFDLKGNLICEGIEPVQRGAYGSVTGIREAARNRKAARTAVASAEAANDYMADAEFKATLAMLDAPDPVPNGQEDQVVAGRFGAPLKDRPASETDAQEAVPAEFLRNMDTALAAWRAKGGKPA